MIYCAASWCRLAEERDVDTLRQISLLLERENQRLIAKNLQLTAELARLRGLPEVEQLTFAVEQTLQQTRAAILDARRPSPPPPRRGRRGRGTGRARNRPCRSSRCGTSCRADQRECPACGGTLTELVGQYETAERITTVKATYHVEHHARQKYRCACNGAVVTAPAPAALIPGGRYTPAFAVGVAVAKYADHLPLERQVRMMAREGLSVESQTLWDQIQALARHLEPTYEALGRQALAAPVIHVDETRWPRLGSGALSAGTVWGVATPTDRLLSHPAREVGGRRAAGARRLSRHRRRRWLRGVRGPGPRRARLRAGALLGAHETQVSGERDRLADGVWRDRRADWRPLRRRAARPGPVSRRRRGAGPATPAAARALAPDRRSHQDVGDRAGRLAAERAGQGRALHARTVDRAHPVPRQPVHPARQQCGRARPARPGRGPEESLRLEVAARHAGRGALLHAV